MLGHSVFCWVCTRSYLLDLFRVLAISRHSLLGLSVKSLILYGVVSLSRFFSILLSDSYLPYDRSGDWVYRCTEGIQVIAIGFLLSFSYRYKYTYYSFIVNHSVSLSKLGFVCRREQEEELHHDRDSSVFVVLPLDCTHFGHIPLRSSIQDCPKSRVLTCCGAFHTMLKPLPFTHNSHCSAGLV